MGRGRNGTNAAPLGELPQQQEMTRIHVGRLMN